MDCERKEKSGQRILVWRTFAVSKENFTRFAIVREKEMVDYRQEEEEEEEDEMTKLICAHFLYLNVFLFFYVASRGLGKFTEFTYFSIILTQN